MCFDCKRRGGPTCLRQVPSVHWQGHLWPRVPRAETWWCRAKAYNRVVSGEWYGFFVVNFGTEVACHESAEEESHRRFQVHGRFFSLWILGIQQESWDGKNCFSFLQEMVQWNMECLQDPLRVSFLFHKMSFYVFIHFHRTCWLCEKNVVSICMFRERNSQASCRIHYHRAQSVEECIAGLLTADSCCLRLVLLFCFHLDHKIKTGSLFQPFSSQHQEYVFLSWIRKESKRTFDNLTSKIECFAMTGQPSLCCSLEAPCEIFVVAWRIYPPEVALSNFMCRVWSRYAFQSASRLYLLTDFFGVLHSKSVKRNRCKNNTVLANKNQKRYRFCIRFYIQK